MKECHSLFPLHELVVYLRHPGDLLGLELEPLLHAGDVLPQADVRATALTLHRDRL